MTFLYKLSEIIGWSFGALNVFSLSNSAGQSIACGLHVDPDSPVATSRESEHMLQKLKDPKIPLMKFDGIIGNTSFYSQHQK